ncbi:hypothetical protein UVI_02008410 [Ustilaginoidea virens]|nr:hypothetical protein UVI_02008410 [Ustilaginoidea virens]
MNPSPTVPNNAHLHAREQDLDPGARYGIMIALAISSGAFFVACIGLAVAFCDWRMRYLHLRKELDDRGYSIADRNPAREETEGAEAARQQQGSEPMASGALAG